MRFQVAIFDIDGVLVDSPHEQGLARVAGAAGGRAVGRQHRRLRARALYQRGVPGLCVGQAARSGRTSRTELLWHCRSRQAAGARVLRYEAGQLLDLIERGAFTAFDDGIRLLLRLKAAGMRIVAASSSKNADLFLRRVPLDRLPPSSRWRPARRCWSCSTRM